MSYRNIDLNVAQLLRTMQAEIDALKAGSGVAKQNTIRLSDWIVETVGDSTLRITNVKTKNVTQIGGPSELPVFSFYGHVEVSVSPSYKVPYNCTITEVAVTLGVAPNGAEAPDGWTVGFPKFTFHVNDSEHQFVGTSEGVHPADIQLKSGDELFLRIEESKGYNLAVVPRLIPNGGTVLLDIDTVIA